jgi:hypothetical protein
MVTTCNPPNWIPSIPPGSTLLTPPLDWLCQGAGLLELAGLSRAGAVCWSWFDVQEPHNPRQRTISRSDPDGYLAACLVAPGVLCASTASSKIHWLRVSGKSLERYATSALDVLVPPVALVSRPIANEVVAVLMDGSAVRLPKP